MSSCSDSISIVSMSSDELNLRLAEIEDEQAKLKLIQGASAYSRTPSPASSISSSSSTTVTTSVPVAPFVALTEEEKEEVDARSVYVGNVDYACTSEDLEAHFLGCGAVARVTIPLDKFSKKPKGFGYVEFADSEGRNNAVLMSDSLLKGRQIKVIEKRTNRPGISTTNRFPALNRVTRGHGGVIVKYVPVYGNGRGRGMRGRGGFSNRHPRV